jgi:DNA repair photolyase
LLSGRSNLQKDKHDMERAKPINSFVEAQAATGKWREEVVSADVAGTPRDIVIFRAARNVNRIKHDWHGNAQTFCPPKWFDLALGSGACGYGCRFCFLMLTFRAMRDPMRPLIYDNIDDYESDVRKWLIANTWHTEQEGRKHFRRTHLDTLGLGIDCSDSLLYEGVTGHARRYIPLFADPQTNPRKNKLILLTKSANTHYLEGLPTENVAVTFSINPEHEADLWEGKFTDTGERITPSVEKRLCACLQAQAFGFEVRWRLDPILTPKGWEKDYQEFFREAACLGVTPRYITLGTYREKNSQLDFWRGAWGLAAPEWEPDELTKDGTHWHLSKEQRQDIYRTIIRLVDEAPWAVKPRVELCKEPHEMRRAVGIVGCNCNCLQ